MAFKICWIEQDEIQERTFRDQKVALRFKRKMDTENRNPIIIDLGDTITTKATNITETKKSSRAD